ncbi:ThuA domain-containing protein [Aquabacterium humicola]|uniref:ThuA domain-containing protein n=1 Tax=Aquabacterium humicola TaxID=3237377 RepID=UPI002543EAF1|nr:ThuA domain-containing protein [Rubrivivax pictus]
MRWRRWLHAAALLAAAPLGGTPPSAIAADAPDGPATAPARRLLLVTTTLGWRHSSIETAERVIAQLGAAGGSFTVELAAVTPPPEPGAGVTAAQVAQYASERAAYADRVRAVLADKLAAASLSRYDAVAFVNTTGELPLPDPEALIAWVRAGGAFVGVHSASDTLHGFRPYIDMLGGEFHHHREQVRVEAVNLAPSHPATRHFGARWNLGGLLEEIYLLQNHHRDAVQPLLALERHPHSGEPGYHGLSWCKPFGRGRVFYTALGHNESVWELPAFQQHLAGGIAWALRRQENTAAPGTR